MPIPTQHLSSEPPRRPRGRPQSMSRDALVRRIQELALRRGGLFRIHLTHPHIYARARRQFGSWAVAIEAAGLSYAETVTRARIRSLETRRRVRRRARQGD